MGVHVPFLHTLMYVEEDAICIAALRLCQEQAQTTRVSQQCRVVNEISKHFSPGPE